MQFLEHFHHRKANIRRGKGFAIVPFHVGAQLECVAASIGADTPALRQLRLERERCIEVQQ